LRQVVALISSQALLMRLHHNLGIIMIASDGAFPGRFVAI